MSKQEKKNQEAPKPVRWLNHESDHDIMTRGKHKNKGKVAASTKIDITDEQNNNFVAPLDISICLAWGYTTSTSQMEYTLKRRRLSKRLTELGYRLKYVVSSKENAEFGHTYERSEKGLSDTVVINPRNIDQMTTLFLSDPKQDK